MSKTDERGKRCIASPYLVDVETIVRELDSDTRAGLSSAQAQMHLGRDGANELRPQPVLLVLSEGDFVGADARLIQANALRVLEASLTGESEPVSKNAARLRTDMPLAERSNMVFKGTAIARGSGLGVVTAVGMATEVGAIAHLLDVTPEEVTPLQKEVREIGRMLGIAVLVIATVVVVAVLMLSEIHTVDDVLRVLLLGVSLAVAAVPEGLPAVLSLVLAFGMLRMARSKAIIKRLSSVETLGSASVICTDKTGTLTRSEMTIQQTMTASGKAVVSGVGYAPKGQIHHQDQPMAGGPVHSENVLLLRGGSLAGNAALAQQEDGNWVIRGDPTEGAFLVAERKLDAPARNIERFERVAEIPFTSDRKMMSALVIDHEHSDERLLISKGAPDVLLQHCTQVQVGMDVVPLTDDLRAKAVAERSPYQWLNRVSSAVNNNMPASMANMNTKACQCPVNRMATAGPGQMPAIPQPMPNNRLPPIRRGSNSRLIGNCMGFPSSELDCWRAQVSGPMATPIAPTMTNAREGSQAPAKSRKASTFPGLAMPARSRPKPNSRPAMNALSLIMFKHPADDARQTP